MGLEQSSEEDFFEAPSFDSASENGLGRKKGMKITVVDMQPLGDGCFRAVGDNGFVYLLAERSSSLFTFVAYLASQRARQGYEHLVMEKRHLASLSKLESITISPHVQPLILQASLEEEEEEEAEQQTKDKQKEKDDFSTETDLEGQDNNMMSSAANALTFTPPPPPPENIPLLPSPFITGTPHLEGYDELVAFRKLDIPGDFFWIRPEELEVFRLLTMSRIGETFFMRMCKEYMLECETSPQTRKTPLEAYVRENELCPYAVFGGESGSKKKLGNNNNTTTSSNFQLKTHGNGLEVMSDRQTKKKSSAFDHGIKSQTPPEDAVRQVLRGYEAFEGSIKASIFTDNLLMLFVSIQKLLQNTIESHGAVETQTASFEISYSVLKEIKLLMDEVKQKLEKSYLHKNCPFKPEDVTTPPSTILINNNNNNMVMLDISSPQHHVSNSQSTSLAPPPLNTKTSYEMDPHKQD